MNVICPLCKGPATQPIMEIYCKAECQKGKLVVKGSRDNLERVIIYGGVVYHVYSGPPPEVYKGSANLHEWVSIKCVDEDDITRSIDNIGTWSRFDIQDCIPWESHHYKNWKLIIIP